MLCLFRLWFCSPNRELNRDHDSLFAVHPWIRWFCSMNSKQQIRSGWKSLFRGPKFLNRSSLFGIFSRTETLNRDPSAIKMHCILIDLDISEEISQTEILCSGILFQNRNSEQRSIGHQNALRLNWLGYFWMMDWPQQKIIRWPDSRQIFTRVFRKTLD